MTMRRYRIRAAVYLILVKDNKILLQRRFNTGWMDGKYTLVSGHLDRHETVSQAMVRETMEEAGIKINLTDLKPATVLHRKSPGQEYIDFFFVAKKWEGTPKITEPDKCDDLSWFPLDHLPNNLLAHIKEAIDNYHQHIPFAECGW